MNQNNSYDVYDNEVYELYQEYLNSDEGKLHNATKRMCCFYYEKVLMPKIELLRDIYKEGSDILCKFLQWIDLSYEDFIRYIRYYSLGNGLDEIKEFYDMIDMDDMSEGSSFDPTLF